MSQNRQLRIALVGTGDFGAEFSQYVDEVAQLVAVCDPSLSALALFAKASGKRIAEYQDLSQLLEQIEIDAVVITSPHHTHRSIAVQAAKAGKHVYCDKAMANSVPECWEMVNACKAANVRLMVGHKRRLRPAWARMIELRERLGNVIALHACTYFDSRPYDFKGWWTRRAQSGGTLSLNGVHHLDWMRAMAGDVDTVRAVAGPQVDSRFDFPDTMHVSLSFASGAIGTLDASLSYPLLASRESGGPLVICEHGGVRFVPFLDHLELYWQHRDDAHPHCERFDDLGFDHAFRKELTDFVHWVTDGSPPCLTWKEGLRCVEVIEAAHRSADQDGAVIQLPLYPELEPASTSERAIQSEVS